MKKLTPFYQGLLIFCIIGLPITFAQAKKYWHGVIAWITFLFIFNYVLWDGLIKFAKSLQELQ
jgi:hypothetical protein